MRNNAEIMEVCDELENYHAKDLAGKDALFVCNVKEIRVTKPVEFNDEFAKSLGVDSIDALKDQIKNKISNTKNNILFTT